MLRMRNLAFGGIVGAALLGAALLYPKLFSPKPLEAGDFFPKSEAADLDGKSIPWPQEPFFIIYTRFDAEMGIQMEKYLRLEQQRHIQLLPVVTIVAGSRKEARDLVRQTGSSAAILVDNGQWKRRLGIGGASFRLFLIDQRSRITFAADYAEPDDLRQLNDKALRGQITYASFDRKAELHTGDQFGGFGVVDMRTSEETVFTSPTKSLVICFTSHCPACDLEEEIRRYALRESQTLKEGPATLLFSSRFSRADLIKTADRYGIKARLLQASENIPGLEDPVSLETFAPTEIVRLDLAAHGMVERITYWNSGNTKKAGGL